MWRTQATSCCSSSVPVSWLCAGLRPQPDPEPSLRSRAARVHALSTPVLVFMSHLHSPCIIDAAGPAVAASLSASASDSEFLSLSAVEVPNHDGPTSQSVDAGRQRAACVGCRPAFVRPLVLHVARRAPQTGQQGEGRQAEAVDDSRSPSCWPLARELSRPTLEHHCIEGTLPSHVRHLRSRPGSRSRSGCQRLVVAHCCKDIPRAIRR